LARLAPAVTPKLLGIGRREVSSSRRIAEFKIGKNQGDSDFALDINGFSLFWKRMRNRYEGNQDIVLGINRRHGYTACHLRT
jgi:hypothetical protein